MYFAYFLIIWHTFIDIMMYFFYNMTYMLTLCHTFWRLIWYTFWLYDIPFKFMTYFPYILTSWRTFWRHDVLFWCDDIFAILCDVMTYSLTLWRIFCHIYLCHDILPMKWNISTTNCPIALKINTGVKYQRLHTNNYLRLDEHQNWIREDTFVTPNSLKCNIFMNNCPVVLKKITKVQSH